MTRRSLCRALYQTRLDLSAVYDPQGLPQGVSGPEDGDPSGGAGPEIGDPGEYIHWLDHASDLTSNSSSLQ
jgi:hypothetical protein